nr:PREDICTED: nucleolar protein 9 [Linepithema humile]
MSEVHEAVGKKRKQRRSHTQMVKKFARQRDTGSNLDQDTYQYLIRILDLMRKDFSTSEEKIMFVQNVYQEITGREAECARNQVGSRVMESLLKHASLEAIQTLVQAFEVSLRQLSSDKFASHVLQEIIVVCADRGNRIPTSTINELVKDKTITPKLEKTDKLVIEDKLDTYTIEVKSEVKSYNAVVIEDKLDTYTIEVKPSEVKSYNAIVLKLSKYFLNNIEEFAFDTYANHVLRTVVECLAGLIGKSDNEDKKKFTVPCLAKRRPVIQEYKDLLIQSCNQLQKWPLFRDFAQKDITSGLVQCVLYSLKDVDLDLTKTIIKKIIIACFKSKEDEHFITNVFATESCVRLLEACLMVAQPKTFKKLYKIFFAGKLELLCLTQKFAQSSNFSVQRLMDYCVTKEIFEEIFDEISEYFPRILQRGFTGILISAGNACKRLQTKQGAFVNAMIKSLECDKSTEDQAQLMRCIVTLKSPTQLESTSDKSRPILNLHGSLITQAILNFNKPIKIVNSLLQMDNEELLWLFGDPKGSRILDAFMDSKYIGEKSREKLYKKLHGIWAELAKSTHGSRCVDKMWASAHMKQKLLIMEELAAAGESLRSTKSGQIIFTKLNVALFARNKKDWSETQGKEEKTRALFADIIGKTKK